MGVFEIFILVLAYRVGRLEPFEAATESGRFQLLKQCQRSTQVRITVDNVANLEECMELAMDNGGLAFNYSPIARRQISPSSAAFSENVSVKVSTTFSRRNREHFWDVPQEFFNCHILECPENASLLTMVNDSRFDYFSLYQPMESKNYSCLPGIGIVVLQTTPLSFDEATKACQNLTSNNGALAHVVSEPRTKALTEVLVWHQNATRKQKHVAGYEAYVGLRQYGFSTNFYTPQNNSLSRYWFRAWAPGYPILKANVTCVALTTYNTWITVNCSKKRMSICELSPLSNLNAEDSGISAGNSNELDCIL